MALEYVAVSPPGDSETIPFVTQRRRRRRAQPGARPLLPPPPPYLPPPRAAGPAAAPVQHEPWGRRWRPLCPTARRCASELRPNSESLCRVADGVVDQSGRPARPVLP